MIGIKKRQTQHVALVSPRYAPSIGGIERSVEALARGLAGRGINVDVITTNPDGTLPHAEELNGITVRRFPTLNSERLPYLAPQLVRWLRDNARRYTLIHAHSYHTPLAVQVAAVSWWKRVPFVVTPYYQGSDDAPLRRVLRLPYRLLGNWMLHHARQVICISETERDLLTRHFGSSIAAVTIPIGLGVDIEELVLTPPYEKPAGHRVLLSVGPLHFDRQHGKLLSALAYLPQEYYLVIIGEGPARSWLEKQARRLRTARWLHMPGNVTRSTLLRWYRTADVFVSLAQYETFGIALLEGAAGGAAVVASDIPAYREAAYSMPDGLCTFISPGCSPAELARALAYTASLDRSEFASGWLLPTWEAAVNETISCYRNALEQ